MPLLVNTNAVQIVVEGRVTSSSGQTRRVLNGFIYAQTSGPVPFPSKSVIASEWNVHVWSPIADQLHTSYVGHSISVKNLNDPADMLAAVSVPDSGGTNGFRLPLQVAAFCRLRSVLRGKHFQGAKVFAPVSMRHTFGDEFTPLGVTAWLNVQAACATAFNTPGGYVWTPSVLSRFLSDLESMPPVLDGSYVISAHVNRTLSTWHHRAERRVRVGQLRSYGGVKMGGAARFITAPHLRAHGGVKVGGTARMRMNPGLEASGGVKVGGAAALSVP